MSQKAGVKLPPYPHPLPSYLLHHPSNALLRTPHPLARPKPSHDLPPTGPTFHPSASPLHLTLLTPLHNSPCQPDLLALGPPKQTTTHGWSQDFAEGGHHPPSSVCLSSGEGQWPVCGRSVPTPPNPLPIKASTPLCSPPTPGNTVQGAVNRDDLVNLPCGQSKQLSGLTQRVSHNTSTGLVARQNIWATFALYFRPAKGYVCCETVSVMRQDIIHP